MPQLLKIAIILAVLMRARQRAVAIFDRDLVKQAREQSAEDFDRDIFASLCSNLDLVPVDSPSG
jgi:hypothetical protein